MFLFIYEFKIKCLVLYGFLESVMGKFIFLRLLVVVVVFFFN